MNEPRERKCDGEADASGRARYVLLCQQALVCAAVAAVAAPAAGIVTLDIVSPSHPRVSEIGTSDAAEGGSLVASEPVAPAVRKVRLSAPTTGRSSRPRLDGRGAPSSGRSAVSRPEQVTGYATVGVTWDHGVKVAEGQLEVSVRTLKDGTWSDWQPMEYHDDHAPDAGTEDARHDRPGTEPYVIGDVDDVQVKAVAADGVPAGLELDLIDPGITLAPRVERPAIDTARLTSSEPAEPVEPVEPAEPVEPEIPEIVPVAGVDVTPQPQIYSRAQWGADERMRDKSALHYGEVHAAFVHHTVNANNYTRAQVPAIIRGIYAYHTQSRGWSDVGYNFLVDRFGRIWEGRYGGVARPVVGAHTLGYNEYAFAMSAIGNYETVKPSAAVVDAYGRLFAWKLSLHGVAGASSRQLVGRKYFPAVNGHRDAGSTACPGRYLYARLGDIRALTAKYQRPFTSRNLRTQISGTGWPDLLVRDKATKTLSIVRTGGQLRFAGGRKIATGWNAMDLIAYPGDLNRDGYSDVIGRNRATGLAGIYPGTATGKLGAPLRTVSRFKSFDLLTGVGDFNGDGRNDLVARNATSKALVLIPSTGATTFGRAVRLATSWGYTSTTGVGDFNSDGRPDLVARDSAGGLVFFPGGGNKLGVARRIASGIAPRDIVAGRGDVTNDGRADLLLWSAVTRTTRIFAGDGAGGLGSYFGPFDRFKNLNWLSGAGQFVGSAAGDVIGRNSAGDLVAFANSGGLNIAGVFRTNVSLAGTNLLLNVGDWNKDGYGDVMSRTTAGQMLLRLGRGNDTFAAPVVAGTGWQGLSQIVSVGDVTGDGNNDLMARVGTTGAFKVYAGNGVTGFASSFTAHSAVSSNRQVAVGLFDGDGAPDTMLTRSDGSLWFYPGNGPGGMTSGRRVGSGLHAYDWLVGLGDLDGDRRSDLIVRSNGSLYLMPGKPGGFGRTRVIAAGFSGYDLAG
jgi:hypothetical protein